MGSLHWKAIRNSEMTPQSRMNPVRRWLALRWSFVLVRRAMRREIEIFDEQTTMGYRSQAI